MKNICGLGLIIFLAAATANARTKLREPKKSKCNEIEWHKKCSEISHYRGKDYIVFHWHDKATLCEINAMGGICHATSATDYIAIREGCEISWCTPEAKLEGATWIKVKK